MRYSWPANSLATAAVEASSAACRHRRGRHLHHLGVRHVPVEPAATLGQGLGMREDTLDVAEIGGAGEEVVVNLERHLSADQELRVDQPVEGVVHHPSLEFSIGTTPTSARPRSTSSKTSGMPRAGRNSALEPKCRSAARCVLVPWGPR